MTVAIAEECRRTGQPVPETEGQFVRCALESLALKYRMVLTWMEELTGVPVQVIHVVGGRLSEPTAESIHRRRVRQAGLCRTS